MLLLRPSGRRDLSEQKAGGREGGLVREGPTDARNGMSRCEQHLPLLFLFIFYFIECFVRVTSNPFGE